MAKNTALATVTGAALMNWDDPKMLTQIKETYGKNLTETEWTLFIGLGKATKLNPFLREIWAVKYGSNAASVFVGRDGYRRSAQAHPEYEYHYVMAVYSKDTFKITNGEVEHDFNLADRGLLVGAYCVVKRKSAQRAAVNFIKASEYMQKFGVWTTKPDTMCCKVAEAQGLRASFQELFAGTYEESEDWKDDAQDAAPAKDPMAPAPGQMDIVTEATKKETTAEQSPPRARRGRPAKTTEAAVDTEGVPGVIDAEVVPPVPTSEVCKHLNIVTTKNADGSQQCPKCGKQLVGPSKNPAPTDENWQQQPGSAFKSIVNRKPAAPAPAPREETPTPPTSRVPEDEIATLKIRTDQTKKLFAVWGEYKKTVGMEEGQSSAARKKLMHDMFAVDSSVKLTESQADELIERISAMTELAKDYSGGEAAAQAQGEAF